MGNQTTVMNAVIVGLLVLIAGPVWAEAGRHRDRPGERQFRERGKHRPARDLRPARGRHWREHGRHREDIGRRWLPARDHHLRKHQNRPRHYRKHHNRPRYYRKHHRGTGHHWRPHRDHHRGRHWAPRRHHRYHRPHRHKPWRGRHHAWQPMVEEHFYHHYDQAESEPAPCEAFEVAASVTDPAGVSFSFSISAAN